MGIEGSEYLLRVAWWIAASAGFVWIFYGCAVWLKRHPKFENGKKFLPFRSRGLLDFIDKYRLHNASWFKQRLRYVLYCIAVFLDCIAEFFCLVFSRENWDWVPRYFKHWVQIAKYGYKPIGLVLAVAILGAMIWLVPGLYIQHTLEGLQNQPGIVPGASITPAELLERETALRVVMAQIVAGLLLVVGVIRGWQQLTITREGQITDRFTKAIEQLGSKQLEIRLGGIYALERIARDSLYDHRNVMEVLTAYVRENSPWPPSEVNAKESHAAQNDPELQELRILDKSDQSKASTMNHVDPLKYKLKTDIQSILTVIGRRGFAQRRMEAECDYSIDLSNTDLRGAKLTYSHFEGADLSSAHLEGSDVSFANMENAKMWDTHLEDCEMWSTVLVNSSLICAYLQGAKLNYTKMRDTDLWDAHLEGATLRFVDGLTIGQLYHSYYDWETEFYCDIDEEMLKIKNIYKQEENRILEGTTEPN